MAFDARPLNNSPVAVTRTPMQLKIHTVAVDNPTVAVVDSDHCFHCCRRLPFTFVGLFGTLRRFLYQFTPIKHLLIVAFFACLSDSVYSPISHPFGWLTPREGMGGTQGHLRTQRDVIAGQTGAGWGYNCLPRTTLPLGFPLVIFRYLWIASWLPHGYRRISFWLPFGYLWISSWLPLGYL